MNNVLSYRQYQERRDEIRCVDRSAERKPSRTFRRHAERLKGRKALTKTEINALCWALNGVKRVDLTEGERRELVDLLEARAERPITREQTAFGIAWLRSKAFRKDGQARQTKDQPFGYRERAIIQAFARFAWVGVVDLSEGLCRGHSYVPVWRTYAKNGAYFDYYVATGVPGGSATVHVV